MLSKRDRCILNRVERTIGNSQQYSGAGLHIMTIDAHGLRRHLDENRLAGFRVLAVLVSSRVSEHNNMHICAHKTHARYR